MENINDCQLQTMPVIYCRKLSTILINSNNLESLKVESRPTTNKRNH